MEETRDKKEKTYIDERYFKFPVRIYQVSGKDLLEYIKNRTEERGEDEEETVEEDAFGWVMGWARLPYNLISQSMWVDNHYKQQNPETVAEEGFDSTTIILPNREEYVTMWKREKLERKLEEYLKNYEEKFGNVK